MTGRPGARAPTVAQRATAAELEGPDTARTGMCVVAALAVLGAAATLVLIVVHAPWNGIAAAPAGMLAVLALCTGGLVAAAVLLRHHRREIAALRLAAADARASERRLRDHDERLVEALDALPVGFALYDKQERLVLYNQTFNRMIQHIGGLDATMIGSTYDEVLTRLEAQMRSVFPDRDLSTWKADYLRRFREREGIDLLWEIGQTVRLRQIPTSSGGTVAIRLDVTDLKRSEEEARAAHKRFDLLAKSLSDAVFSTDRNGRFNYVSGAMSQILGYTPGELIGRRPHDITHPDDRARLDACVVTMRSRRGTPVAYAHRGMHKNGSIRQVEVRMTAPDRSDNLEGQLAVTGVMRDVQAQHEMAERLRYELERLESIVQSSGASMVLVNRGMRILMANKGFLNAAPGRTSDGVIGRPLRDFVKSTIDQTVFDAWFAASPADPLRAIEYETSAIDRQGQLRVYHVTANPVRDESGSVRHIVFVAVDHTERRATEMQLFDTSRLATVGEMASGVAHEINQPLTIIRFAAESLQEELQEASPATPLADTVTLIDAKLARIVSQTERAATIIQELKGFARRPDESPRPFDVPEALLTAAHLLREQLRLSHIEEDLQLDGDIPLVLGHGSRLQQVIINLLINARDAIQERGARADTGRPGGMIRLQARHVPADGKVVITVEDDGPGIPQAVLPRLFEPFFTTKPTGRGTGLGLSVSYQIVRQMGGTIAADNRAEGGARFTITLDALSASERGAAA